MLRNRTNLLTYLLILGFGNIVWLRVGTVRIDTDTGILSDVTFLITKLFTSVFFSLNRCVLVHKILSVKLLWQVKFL